MSKHIDLIAVGALLLAFGLAARVHEMAQLGVVHARFFRVRTLTPVLVEPPRFPAIPRLPRLPRV